LSSDGRNGLAGAVVYKAEAVLDQFSPTQQAVARRIFLRLVQFGEGRADTRRRQPVSALRSAVDEPALFDRTSSYLVDNRLLILSGEAESPERYVDIVHEALLTGWPTLREWLVERREAEQTRRRLEQKVAEWVRLGQGRGGLLDEVELREAEQWLESSDAVELGYDKNLPALVIASRVAIATFQEMIAYRQLTALGTATAAIQHRINNSLNIILPNITHLRRRVDPSDKTTQEILEIIERNTRSISNYITRIQEPLMMDTSVQLVDVNAILREALTQVHNQSQYGANIGEVKMSYDLADSLPAIEAAPRQISEVFRTLIENSYGAITPQGGQLNVVSRQVGDAVQVVIQDTGPGISPTMQARLFKTPVPSRGHEEGSGLGLWLSSILLQRYSGEISIAESGPNGTTMIVTLPVKEPEKPRDINDQ
jgi:signal transduction histidine kinase